MKKVITYGTYDLFHQGHYNLLKRAKDLGDYLIVGVTTDNFDLQRGKINTCNDVMERIEAVRATGLADQIIIEEYKGQKIDDIQKYEVDIFAIGSDWEGYFDYLNEYCEVIYLPRTQGISSTMLRSSAETINIGIIGTGSIANRFVNEAKCVSNNKITTVYNPNIKEAETFVEKHGILNRADSLNAFYEKCNAVYIASPHFTHYEYILGALQQGKHVLCETPLVFKEEEAKEVYSLAESKNLVLMVAHKTAYCPAFLHLISLLKSDIIGDIVDVNASVSTLTDEQSPKMDKDFYGGSMTENMIFPLLPIFKFLGLEFNSIQYFSKMKNGVDIYTKAIIQYKNALASFQVGLGVKTEGSLIISGTKGYAYVPAPWWKTDYFEVRYEDINHNKKYFYPYEGEGLRYEIKEFVVSVQNKKLDTYKLTKAENILMSKLLEEYLNGKNLTKI